uniref:Uncharacterized protein n=1 Tax=Knipowitschia caucasica TaxID=637954 RepID=A0AAV2J5Z2_KNICA
MTSQHFSPSVRFRAAARPHQAATQTAASAAPLPFQPLLLPHRSCRAVAASLPLTCRAFAADVTRLLTPLLPLPAAPAASRRNGEQREDPVRWTGSGLFQVPGGGLCLTAAFRPSDLQSCFAPSMLRAGPPPLLSPHSAFKLRLSKAYAN